MPVGHRVACHWAEEIERGEIMPHEVTPVLVAPDDDGMAEDPFMGPASVTEVALSGVGHRLRRPGVPHGIRRWTTMGP